MTTQMAALRVAGVSFTVSLTVITSHANQDIVRGGLLRNLEDGLLPCWSVARGSHDGFVKPGRACQQQDGGDPSQPRSKTRELRPGAHTLRQFPFARCDGGHHASRKPGPFLR